MFMKCSVQVHSLNLLYGTHPLLLKMPPLSLDSLQKVGHFPRPAGGAVEKNRQLVSPVTVGLPGIAEKENLLLLRISIVEK